MIGTKNKQIKKTPVKILYGKMKKKNDFYFAISRNLVQKH